MKKFLLITRQKKTSRQVTRTGELSKESGWSAVPAHTTQGPEVMGSTWGRFWAAEQPQDTTPRHRRRRRAVCRREKAKPSLRTREVGNKCCEETGHRKGKNGPQT